AVRESFTSGSACRAGSVAVRVWSRPTTSRDFSRKGLLLTRGGPHGAEGATSALPRRTRVNLSPNVLRGPFRGGPRDYAGGVREATTSGLASRAASRRRRFLDGEDRKST